jgi:D-alanyl-D-alanine-carboxypeptidase/D-alanyl-D-alanine-endopeptidase
MGVASGRGRRGATASVAIVCGLAVSSCTAGRTAAPAPARPIPGPAAPTSASSPARPLAPSAAAPIVAQKPSCEKLASLVLPLIERGYSTSVVVALVTHGQTLVCPFGTLGEGGPPATVDTLYEIGSLTKTFTGTLLALMTAERTVRLDEPVNALLPAGTQVPSAPERPITLLDLATHRSGLSRMPDNMPRSQPENPYLDYSADRLYEYLRGATLSHEPGQAYLYSNLGMGLLGHALALRAGRDYDALFRERITEPLGMRDTKRALPASELARLAPGQDGDGNPAPHWDFDVLAPAGGLRSSGRDMSRFVRAALGLEETSVTTALRTAASPRARSGRGRIGLAFHVRADGVRWHNGETAAHSSYLGLDHDKQCGVVVLNGAAIALTDEIGERALHFLGGTPLAPLELPEDAPLEHAADYVGEYPLAADFVLSVQRGGTELTLQATGQGAFRLWHSGGDRFYLRAVEARVAFERDRAGRVSALVLEQGGRKQRASRR